MDLSRARGLSAVVALAVFLLSPGIVSAHALGGTRFDAPLPLPLLLVGAGATVGVTALWLGTAERRPTSDTRTLGTVPQSAVGTLSIGAGVVFLLLVFGAVLHGLVGRQVAAENVATLFVWPVWFRGVALLVLLVGNVWPALSPWQTLYSGLIALEGEEIAIFGDYPEWLGAWPATLGFLTLFGVLENLSATPRSPRLTAGLIAVYTLTMISGAVCFGPVWLQRADPLGTFYRLFARVAPVVRNRTASGLVVSVRLPWQGCLNPVRADGLVVFVVATVYTVSFDGFTSTSLFQTILYAIRGIIGTGQFTGIILYFVGLAGFVATFVVASRVIERLGSGVGATPEQAFAPTILPIAAAYEAAHNYPYILRSLGELIETALVPVRPDLTLEPLGWLPLSAFWGSQVLLIVVGHLIAVVAAHYVAVERYGTERAGRAHLPLVMLMVGYTALSLWIVSQPVVA